MNRILCCVLAGILGASPVFCEESISKSLSPKETLAAISKDKPAPVEADKQVKDDVFSISTDDLDAAESLDRISGGRIDTGYSKPDQSYKSNASGAGPFSREKQAMSDNQ